MKLRRAIYNWGTILMTAMSCVMLTGLMIWYVYEADDLGTALIMGGIMLAMVCREAYHQWLEEQRHSRRR